MTVSLGGMQGKMRWCVSRKFIRNKYQKHKSLSMQKQLTATSSFGSISGNSPRNKIRPEAVRLFHGKCNVPGIICRTQMSESPKALSCASRSTEAASMTVEAAFVFPLFLFAMLMVLGLFEALQVESEMNKALQYAARRSAVICGAVSSGSGQKTTEGETAQQDSSGEDAAKDQEAAHWIRQKMSDAAVLAMGKSMTIRYLKENGCWLDAICNEVRGISFLPSDVSGSFVNLRVSYRIRLPVSIGAVRNLSVSQGVRCRKWTGYAESGSKEDSATVYITAHGNAYHKSTSCRYLDLSIHAADRSDVKNLHNKNGGKYYPCRCSQKKSGTVYITDYGKQFHSDLSCSHLIRTVYQVKKSEAGSRHACAGCYGEDR